MSEFKVGDTVRVVDDIVGNLPVPIGSEGEVEEVFEFEPEQNESTKVDVRFGDNQIFCFDVDEVVRV